MKNFLLFLLICFSLNESFAGEKKKITAIRVNDSPKIDGVLDEPVWSNAPMATDFIQHETSPGLPSDQKSEVKLIYDNTALYVGAILYDVSSDSILRELGKRDTEGNTDIFGILLDTYMDGINAFGFFVTSAGVQIDAKYSSNGQDFDWNAVWESKVQITGNNWIVELKIPYSAIRFSKMDLQLWGINFIRKIRRHREMSFWNNVDPAIEGFINQFGELNGVEKIESPVRLSLTPYVSGYADHYKNLNKPFTSTNFNFGTDVKYGINESFTLDMTLVPDFGQVQSDNQILNLSPFEVQFNDFRPFFTEGTELFNRGGLFYSRRVGGTPLGYYEVQKALASDETLVNNPSSTPMLNATKISGRTSKGLGIGLFNATTNTTYATIENTEGEIRKLLTDPLSNYSVAVFDQSLRNNSFVSFVNTNVMREGSFYDANVSGMQFKLLNKKITHSLSGNATLSQKYHAGLASADMGHAYEIGFSKVSGNFQYFLNHNFKSNTYDPRDLGFLFNNNQVNYITGIRYNIYKPFWKVNNFFSNMDIIYSRLYSPDVFQDFAINLFARTTFTKKFMSTGLFVRFEPVITYDYFEPRVPGRFYKFPTNYTGDYWISSDYRKKFALDAGINYRIFNEGSRHNFNYSLSPRYRVNNKLSFIVNFDSENRFEDVGYVNIMTDTIIFGVRDVNTITNTLASSYTFTNLMALSVRVRHYWSKAKYGSFHTLNEDGSLGESTYNDNHDINFNAFNVDMVYTWNFAPGSEMSIVWKNAILQRNSSVINDYLINFKNTIESPQLNSISLKLLYFIDYLSLKKKKKHW